MNKLLAALVILGLSVSSARAADDVFPTSYAHVTNTLLSNVVPPQSTDAFTEAPITITASGNTAVVAAVSAKKTKMYRLILSCQGPTIINIEDDSSVVIGPIYLGAGGAMTLDYSVSGSPWVIGTTNKNLNINSSSVVNCGGLISYLQN